MNKRILALCLALCLALTGCASLLERSYSVVEPYADRFWESGVEDTLKVENYQDLVNSLLMQVEQRAQECVIRFYQEPSAEAYQQILDANREVREESVLGSYLLWSMSFSNEKAEGYYTLNYHMIYREDAEDPDSLMTLSDSQSLVDLLRMAVREGHGKLTARFVHDTPREEVSAAVESLWRELCLDEQEEESAGEPETPPGQEENGVEAGAPSDPEGEQAPEGEAPAEEQAGAPEDAEAGQPGEELPEEEPVQYPPCPWEIRFYPDLEAAGIVEILLG